MTLKTNIRVRATRLVRDLIRGDNYVVVARFPGGREIIKAKAKTKARATQPALEAAKPQTSPTAGGGASYTGPGVEPGKVSEWKDNKAGIRYDYR